MEGRSQADQVRDPIALAVAIAAAVIAFSLLWMASEAHYSSCVEKAAVKYPAVPVSAFVNRDKRTVGPLKASFARERSSAVDDCHRFF